MRRTLLASLLLFALVVTGCRHRGARVDAKRVVTRAPAKAVQPVKEADPAAPAWRVQGWGRDRQEAEQDALKRAGKVVASHLRSKNPAVAWAPTPEYVRKHLVRGEAERDKEGDEHIPDGFEGIDVQCWR